jgi:hypothetical protein
VIHLGFEVRVELALDDGVRRWAQATRNDVERLRLDEGAAIHVRPSRTQTFAESAA